MIARVHFEGKVEHDKKKSSLPDYVDIHVPPDGLTQAKQIFLGWIGHGTAIRGGDNGVFHPLMGYGDIKITRVVEVVGEEEGLCLNESVPAPIPGLKSKVVKAKKGRTYQRPAFPIEGK